MVSGSTSPPTPLLEGEGRKKGAGDRSPALALHYRAKLLQTGLHKAVLLLTRLSCAAPCIILPIHYSQTSSRQLGGMIPSANAFAIMPRCLISLRKTWQRRHKTRRLSISLPDNLPERTWSMWHSFRATGVSQWKHLPPSRSQTLRRVSYHISRGCRFLGIFTLSCYASRSQPHHAKPGPTPLRRTGSECLMIAPMLCPTKPSYAGPNHSEHRRTILSRAPLGRVIPVFQMQPPQSGPCRSSWHFQSQQSDQHHGGQHEFDYR